MKGILFVASGPSGTGKTTLCRMVENRLKIPHSVSYTTRPPRLNEVNGRDYHFVDDPTFDRMAQDGAFLEWARVHDFRYGTPAVFVKETAEKGSDLILDLDTQGAFAVKRADPQAVLIFIDVPDSKVLEERLGRRGTEDYDKMKRRLAQAELERREKDKYDHLVVNDDLEKAYQKLEALILQERSARRV